MAGPLRLALCLPLLWRAAIGELILGISLTLTGRYDEVLKGQEIKRTLELLVEQANIQTFSGNGFRDFRGNGLFFELKVEDDAGDPEKVGRIYSRFIDQRLVDLLLGPQTHALSDVAARISYRRNRTIMMYSHLLLPSNAFPPENGRSGVFSTSLPASEHMQEGLRIAQSLGSTSVAIINGQSQMHRSMCRVNFASLGYLPPVAEEEPTDSYEMLLAMQRVVAAQPDVILTCVSEPETAMAIVAASRVSTTAQAMLMYSADSNAVFNGVSSAIDHLMSANAWHFTQDFPCRVFGRTANFVDTFRSSFGNVPSTLSASALGAALSVMATIEQIVFEGEDSEKNLRLTDALRQGRGIDTAYGRLQFQFDGRSPRSPVTLQLRAQEEHWTSHMVSPSNLTSLVYPLPSWESKSQLSASCPPGYIVNPNLFNSSQNQEDCLACQAGETSSENGQYCKVCALNTFSPTSGTQCQACAAGADCRTTGTSIPESLPGFYRLDNDPRGQLHFFRCQPTELCVGRNECVGSNAGALCSSCIAGHTNLGFLRNGGQCSECFPMPVLVVFFILYIGIVYFIIAKTAQASEQGQTWKRVVAYCQLCSAATQAGELYVRAPVLQMLSDLILYPFHSILGPDCLFTQTGSVTKEGFVFVVGVALLPCLFVGTTIFFTVATGIGQQLSGRQRRGQQMSGGRRDMAKAFISTVVQGATRWNVASLYVLYCPTLAIFFGSLSFVELDVLRLRFFVDVTVDQALEFSIISGAITVLQGFAIPVTLWIAVRRLRRRHLLSDETWQYVFGMLYKDFKPEYWFFEILLFYQKFALMAVTAVPNQMLRICGFFTFAFLYSVSLLLFQPFSSVNGYMLQRLEYCFLMSILCIMTSQLMFEWASYWEAAGDSNAMGAVEVVAPIFVYCAHGVFAILVFRAFLRSLVYHPLTIKAIAMPQAMNRIERLICHVDSMQRLSWDKENQRLSFLGFSAHHRRQLCEIVASALGAYVFTRHKKPIFHASFLTLAINEAIEMCKKRRSEELQAVHSRILMQQKRGGCAGCALYWCPAMVGTEPVPAEGIALARQQRSDRRSFLAALPRVCTPQASLDELRAVFEWQHFSIIKGKEQFFEIWDTPQALKNGASRTRQDSRKTKNRSELLRVLSSAKAAGLKGPGDAGEAVAVEQEVETKIFSPEQIRQRLPGLRQQVQELRQEAARVRAELDEVQAQLEVHKMVAADTDEEEEEEEEEEAHL